MPTTATPPKPHPPPQATSALATSALATPMTSAELLRGMREITILHAGEAYRLRLTSKDRLILTK